MSFLLSLDIICLLLRELIFSRLPSRSQRHSQPDQWRMIIVGKIKTKDIIINLRVLNLLFWYLIQQCDLLDFVKYYCDHLAISDWNNAYHSSCNKFVKMFPPTVSSLLSFIRSVNLTLINKKLERSISSIPLASQRDLLRRRSANLSGETTFKFYIFSAPQI